MSIIIEREFKGILELMEYRENSPSITGVMIADARAREKRKKKEAKENPFDLAKRYFIAGAAQKTGLSLAEVPIKYIGTQAKEAIEHFTVDPYTAQISAQLNKPASVESKARGRANKTMYDTLDHRLINDANTGIPHEKSTEAVLVKQIVPILQERFRREAAETGQDLNIKNFTDDHWELIALNVLNEPRFYLHPDKKLTLGGTQDLPNLMNKEDINDYVSRTGKQPSSKNALSMLKRAVRNEKRFLDAGREVSGGPEALGKFTPTLIQAGNPTSVSENIGTYLVDMFRDKNLKLSDQTSLVMENRLAGTHKKIMDAPGIRDYDEVLSNVGDIDNPNLQEKALLDADEYKINIEDLQTNLNY